MHTPGTFIWNQLYIKNRGPSRNTFQNVHYITFGKDSLKILRLRELDAWMVNIKKPKHITNVDVIPHWIMVSKVLMHILSVNICIWIFNILLSHLLIFLSHPSLSVFVIQVPLLYTLTKNTLNFLFFHTQVIIIQGPCNLPWSWILLALK